jgi:hypothetical protein
MATFSLHPYMTERENKREWSSVSFLFKTLIPSRSSTLVTSLELIAFQSTSKYHCTGVRISTCKFGETHIQTTTGVSVFMRWSLAIFCSPADLIEGKVWQEGAWQWEQYLEIKQAGTEVPHHLYAFEMLWAQREVSLMAVLWTLREAGRDSSRLNEWHFRP